ncbi:MAG: aminodeoxychorismate/anthranilate synthase component II [Deltaproteobacteria bacterium]|nr:aminodeoxychorismate/anthranilate synthase component II [Deltaproteobacteria bacterium]MBW1987150.1 aminodeoxychorismate/anthranilate synthase component II [Deltaproteobacteria bacterium]MBW2135362.1 aminodeoxychorismate/anthranilate synthase component II [Deltaproteobacteria bacterium]
MSSTISLATEDSRLETLNLKFKTAAPHIAVIDNYDSFTYNLVQYLGVLGAQLTVYRNDQIDLDGLERLQPSHLVISPGPGYPKDAGISVAAVQHFAGRLPILGVCLGHQAVAEAFGGRIIPASRLMHGKTSLIYHDNQDLFQGLPLPFEATRYHSLIVHRAVLPDCLKVTAQTAVGEIMGLRHVEYAIYGVQFHPESIMTSEGLNLLRNFLKRQRG